jgi:hypothetical protein
MIAVSDEAASRLSDVAARQAAAGCRQRAKAPLHLHAGAPIMMGFVRSSCRRLRKSKKSGHHIRATSSSSLQMTAVTIIMRAMRRAGGDGGHGPTVLVPVPFLRGVSHVNSTPLGRQYHTGTGVPLAASTSLVPAPALVQVPVPVPASTCSITCSSVRTAKPPLRIHLSYKPVRLRCSVLPRGPTHPCRTNSVK